MIEITNKVDCCGCMACAQACPQKCIEMKTDKEGFWYPQVDKDRCIDCGVCDYVCPMDKRAESSMDKLVYACWNKEEALRLYSTSGGVFQVLAKEILQRNGYVAGAVYREDFSVGHVVIHDIEKLSDLLQSKYLQSDIGDVFLQIKRLATQGEQVLFCGTPCQNEALKLFLGKEYENVYQCDFICRGVISPLVFQEYLKWLENEFDSKVKKVHFKNKDYGWNQFSTKIEFENGKDFQRDRFNDPYMVSFLEHNIDMRYSCHECRFKGTQRASDITLGDFWGIGEKKRELDDNKGTSVVMINTEKGRQLFESVKDAIEYSLCEVEDIRRGNACLEKCPPVNAKRDKFFILMNKKGFGVAYRKYCKKPWKVRMKKLIKKVIRR